jgi:hypothetical protein
MPHTEASERLRRDRPEAVMIALVPFPDREVAHGILEPS